MKILVTGHSGLLGSNLVTLLNSQGHEVFGVSRTNRMGMKNNFYCTDLTKSEATEFVFKKFKPEIVYHLAANAAEAKGQVSPIDMTERNILMSMNVFRSAINVGVKKIVYASSVSVYGDAPTPYDEQSQPKPKDIYGVNKLATEVALTILSEVYGFDYTIFRPHNLYGPGQNPNDLTKNVVNLFMRKIIERQPYAILGEGKVQRGFSYVEDVVKVFSEAVTNFSKLTMNVGTTQVHTIGELSGLLQKISNSSVPVEHKPLRKQEIDVFIASHKVQEHLTNYYETPFIVGLQKTWEWMQTQKLHEPLVIREEIYV